MPRLSSSERTSSYPVTEEEQHRGKPPGTIVGRGPDLTIGVNQEVIPGQVFVWTGELVVGVSEARLNQFIAGLQTPSNEAPTFAKNTPQNKPFEAVKPAKRRPERTTNARPSHARTLR